MAPGSRAKGELKGWDQENEAGKGQVPWLKDLQMDERRGTEGPRGMDMSG